MTTERCHDLLPRRQPGPEQNLVPRGAGVTSAQKKKRKR